MSEREFTNESAASSSTPASERPPIQYNAEGKKIPRKRTPQERQIRELQRSKRRKRRHTKEEVPASRPVLILREIAQWALTFAAALTIAYLANSFVLVNAQIPTGSMENTIMPGDRVIGNRLAYLNSDPERFDIVIFHYPDDETQLFIKRIIGLPGETVEIRDGSIFLNGSNTPIQDVETKDYMSGTFGPYVVPEGCYFVMGDNRNDSKDSRFWTNTYVAKEKILGKALFRYWPIDQIKMLQ